VPIIINGGSRSAGGWWAKHLENGEKNERVEVIEFVGLSAATVPDAFREMEGISLGSKCTNYFYQANINPRADERLTSAQWREAVDTLERNLGLTGQPRFVVEHEKEGRTHRHIVWSRIDPERMTAISDSLTAKIHERTSRELEIKFDLERGQSILVPDRKTDRPDRRPKKHETFREMESGIDPETVKADARWHWHSADNGQSFKAALEASGDYVLARGDRRDFVIIDRAGDDHSLARRLGVKAAEMRARMADLDPANLPSVQEAKAQQQARQAEREAHEAAKGRYDRLRETERDVQRDQFSGRYDDLRAAEPPPEIVREFESNANRTAEPAAPVYDRDADNTAWEAKLAEAAINAEAQKSRQQPDASTARETRAAGPEPFHGPESDANGRIDIEGAVHDAATDIVAEAAHEGAKVSRGVLRRLARAVESVVGFLGDFLFAPPSMTRDQAELAARAAGEQAEVNATVAAQREKEADQDERIFNQDRQQQQEEQSFAARYGTPGSKSAAREREDDYDRGRERER
jgi:hypothetical protein